MNRLRAGAGAAGALATVLAAAAVFAPGVVGAIGPLSGLVDAAAGLDARATLLAVGLVLALLAVVLARTAGGGGDDPTDPFDQATAIPPEAPTADRRAVAGADLDAAIDRAAAGDDEALATVRSRLSTLAVAAVAQSAEGDREAAAAAVSAGEWTDDAVAAAVLADGAAGRHSLGRRLWLWLDPERERRRRIERTVAAIEARLEGGA